MDKDGPPPRAGRTAPPSPDQLRERQRDKNSPRGVLLASRTANNSSLRDARKTGGRRANDIGRMREKEKEKRSDGSHLMGTTAIKTTYRTPGDFRRPRSSNEGDLRVEVTPANTSASRSGRQFTVANVGRGGQIYMRPSIQSVSQRYQESTFLFPQQKSSTPATACPDNSIPRYDDRLSDRDSLRTEWPTHPLHEHTSNAGKTPALPALPIHPAHKRACSHSTVDARVSPLKNEAPGAFRVVIDRAEVSRPKTAGDLRTFASLGDITIPSWKLGTPRFSIRGTPFIRGSSYAPTEDVRSSTYTTATRERSRDRSVYRDRRRSIADPMPPLAADHCAGTPGSSKPRSSTDHDGAISPSIFDNLTMRPECDDRAVVRYAVPGLPLTAATPPRLIAEITSPYFLDYDLLSDFFLTYRSYLKSTDLLAMLIARLRWASSRDDDIGMAVRVRTFVALRHWILNYFLDDFVLDYVLRKKFCELLNAFVAELSEQAAVAKNQIRILGELKKCWRRTCALYWDGPDFQIGDTEGSPIVAGGIAGSRNPDLTPECWERAQPEGPARLDNIFDHDNISATHDYFSGLAGNGDVEHIKPFVRPESRVLDREIEGPASPNSILSEEITSCSFPMLPRSRQASSSHGGAHPVSAALSCGKGTSTFTASRPNTAQRKAQRAHVLNVASTSTDDRRREPSQISGFQVVVPYAGSLVRGNLFPPGQSFVKIGHPVTPTKDEAVPFFHQGTSNANGSAAMSEQGMKKLMGSVRRAIDRLATIPSPGNSPTTATFPTLSTNCMPSQHRALANSVMFQPGPYSPGVSAPMRIDLLGAGIAEDFRKAVRENAKVAPSSSESKTDETTGVASTEQVLLPTQVGGHAPRPLAHEQPIMSTITTGSQSIMVFNAPDAMSSGQEVRHSQEGEDVSTYVALPTAPTPPRTPSAEHMGADVSSSAIVGHTPAQTASIDRTPSLLYDHHDPSLTDHSPDSRQALSRPSIYSHSRGKRSESLRRYASFHSGLVHHHTQRSFDATTFSGSIGRSPSILMTAPLHVLRRRPGGNLRAVNNIGDLQGPMLRKAHSISSIGDYSDSLHGSYIMPRGLDLGQGMSDRSVHKVGSSTFSLGELTAPHARKPLSLISTHSSQPIFHASMQEEVAKLAQIPDEADDDGGVESALLKLEGRYEKTNKSATPDLGDAFDDGGRAVDDSSKRKHRGEHVLGTALRSPGSPEVYLPKAAPATYVELQPTVYRPTDRHAVTQSVGTTGAATDSYYSIPLLQRDHSVEMSMTMSAQRSHQPPTNIASRIVSLPNDMPAPLSYDLMHAVETFESVQSEECIVPVTANPANDDTDAESDLSSEMSLESVPEPNEFEIVKNGFGRRRNNNLTDLILPAAPLRQPSSNGSGDNGRTATNYSLPSPQLYSPQLRQHFMTDERMPPTPEITPTYQQITGGKNSGQFESAQEPMRPTLTTVQPIAAAKQGSVHLPFILAFDSKVLAQQFTLVEKDALNEIDWKELIDLRWQSSSSNARSWIEFLRTADARGVEVVISRFNIVVKWAVSEIVLTRNLEERAQAIIKYIHIAAHCRRYRNYATLYQLVVALSSTDVQRLRTTWSLVHASEINTLTELEALVSPARNFHNLRNEMETQGSEPCIPFIGVYTHDLLVNAARPAVIISAGGGVDLINFERCRTSASIVKNLLRLLESAAGYGFVPVEGVTERCLWLAGLSDAEVEALGLGIS